MLKKFILVLLCISSYYKSLGESNKTENNLSAIESKKVSSNDKQLKPVYLEAFGSNFGFKSCRKKPVEFRTFIAYNNTKPIVVDIQENFEGLDRGKGTDIRTARQRELVPNSLLGDF